MSKGQDTKARIVEVASRLFQAQGYAATGLKQLLEESQAPRGSFYFHFPQGKEELAAEVISQHTARFSEGLIAMTDSAPDTLSGLKLVLEALAQQVQDSPCEAGCPVMALTLEMSAHSDELRALLLGAFERWRALLAARFERDGHSAQDAQERAMVLLGAVEGALMMSRAYGDRRPLDALAARLEVMFA